MLKGVIRFASTLLFTSFLISTACAQGNDWRIAQLYSNADGTMQLIRLEYDMTREGEPSSMRMAGRTLVASSGGTEHRFTFPSDFILGGGEWDSAARTVCGFTGSGVGECRYYLDMWIMTKSFNDLNVLRAISSTYVVPDGFLFLSNGSLRLDDITVRYDALPVDGMNTLSLPSGQSSSPSLDLNHWPGLERLFINYTGQWWAAPAGSESGWGINFSHQGDTIFGTWLTYDANGRPSWLTFTMTAWGSSPDGMFYWGSLYRHNGAPFGAFVPPATATRVGFVNLDFASTTNATFHYNMNTGPSLADHQQIKWWPDTKQKAIVLQTFGSAPACQWGIQPDLTKATNYQGLWYAAPAESESGWGVSLTHQGNTIFATWFTYDANRDPLWLSVSATQTGPNTYSGTLDRTTGPAFGAVPFGPVQHHSVGRATFTFTHGNAGTFAYDVDLGDGVNRASQSKAITRQVFNAPGTVCH